MKIRHRSYYGEKGLLLTLCHCQRVPARSIFSLNRHRFLLYMKSVKPMGGSRYMNTLENIQNSMDLLSKSERKVAEVILASPQTAIHSSIATLAKMANVSEPTVNRFCRRLETKGFPDFKLHLAQSLANGTPYVNRNVEEDDSVAAYTGKIFESTMASLDRVKNNLDIAAINRAVDLLTQAKKSRSLAWVPPLPLLMMR